MSKKHNLQFKIVIASLIVVAFSCVALTTNLHAQVTFDWATVGNPGNAPDQDYGDGQFGAVANTYRISKYEVTNTQYTEFLNAVARTDTNGLYSSFMDSDARGGITQTGSSGGFSYAVKSGRGNNPVILVSFLDAMRFVNWLENGQPTGAQGSGTTEDGVYTISNGFSETRAASASFFLPSEDEWYKAAYHKNDGVTGNYWDYPTSSDTVPTSEPPAGGANSANFFDETTGYAVTGSTIFDDAQNYLTDVGAYTQSLSPYGTFDQGGNLLEWNEEVTTSVFRGLRGGYWDGTSNTLAASFRIDAIPAVESINIGFRVASIPEPSSGLLLVLATVRLLMRRRTVS